MSGRNQWEEDDSLQRVLRRFLPAQVFDEIRPDLFAFGARVITDVAKDASLTDFYLPQLVQLRPWGQRVDHIAVHEAWDRLHDVAAQEGLIAIGYERLYQGK
jgi:putative acyl-CoA dehydrogenase